MKMNGWRIEAYVDILTRGLTESFGEKYGENFKDMIFNIPSEEKFHHIIFETFVEYTCNIIRDQIGNYDIDILDYIENIVNDFYRKIIETDIDEISSRGCKYVSLDHYHANMSNCILEELFNKALPTKIPISKAYIIYRDIEVPPMIYFWILKTEIATSIRDPRNISIHNIRLRSSIWKHKRPFRCLI